MRKKCKQCGTSERRRNGRCKFCANEATKRYSAANPEKTKAKRERWYKDNPGYNKEYYEENKESIAKWGKEYRRANEDKLKEQRKSYYKDNKDKILENQKEYRKNNTEKTKAAWSRWAKKTGHDASKQAKEWRKNNPQRAIEIKQRRRARKAGVKSESYDFAAICKRYKNKCVRCGKRGKLTRDHVVPISHGGDDVEANIQPLCLSCNASKGNRHSTDYRNK